jgi:hypothetical protein
MHDITKDLSLSLSPRSLLMLREFVAKRSIDAMHQLAVCSVVARPAAEHFLSLAT